MSDSVDRPHRITLYDKYSGAVHTDTFATMDDAERTYGNMCKALKEDRKKGKTDICKITLSTVYSEITI